MNICPACSGEYGPEVRFCPRDGSALRPAGGDSGLVGRVLNDSYHVLRLVGEGGMGQVYLAEHVKMGRRCAVKVMNRALARDPDLIGRFAREATNASRINHPNIVSIYDFGETSDGVLFLAMEYVEGETLTQILRRERRLPPARAAEIAHQIGEALHAAHDLGIVHRDLKPDNVLVARGRDGTDWIKVVDFGISKAGEGDRRLTRTGFTIGTPEYMSPEQLIGDPVDGRSDLYSLGCILFEMLVGEQALSTPSRESVLTRRLLEPPPRPSQFNPEVPRPLDDLVVRTLARSPSERPQSAGEFCSALAHAMQEASGAPVSSGRPRRSTPWSGIGLGGTTTEKSAAATGSAPASSRSTLAGSGRLLAATAAVLVILVAGGIYLWTRPGDPALVDAPAVASAMVEPETEEGTGRQLLVQEAPAGSDTPETLAEPASPREPRSGPVADSPAPAPTGGRAETRPPLVQESGTGRPAQQMEPSPPAPAPADVPAEPPADELRGIRSDLAIGRVQFQRAEYAEATRLLRAALARVQTATGRYPNSTDLRALDGEIRGLLDTVQRACVAEANLARSRGTTPPNCG